MDAATETPVVADAAVVQKKRGRPKKTDVPTAKKVLKSTTGNAATETTGEKIERRGHPKGSKNSTKAADKVVKKAKAAAPATGEKRKRGRPAKADKEAASEKPAKKAKNAIATETETEVEEKADDIEDGVEDKEAAADYDDGSIPAEAVVKDASKPAAGFEAEDDSAIQEDITDF